MDLGGTDLPDDEDDDVLLKIDSELASSLQPGGESDLLGRGGRRGQTEDFFKEEGREESEVLLNQLLDTSNEVGNNGVFMPHELSSYLLEEEYVTNTS